MTKRWIISTADPHEQGQRLYWNNDSGWGSRETAERFTDSERLSLRLPMEGQWEEDR